MSAPPSNPTSTTTGSLHAAEICSILDKCKQVGVSEFRCGDLFVVFGAARKATKVVAPPPTPEPETPSAQTPTAREEDADDDEIARMAIEDPVAFEDFQHESLNGQEITDGQQRDERPGATTAV